MKKITLLLLMCFYSLVGVAQVTLTEGFEGTSLPASGTWALGSGSWRVFDNGVGLVNTWTANSGVSTPPLVYEGTRAAFMNAAQDNLGAGGSSQDWLVSPATTVPANGQLRFFTRQSVSGDQGNLYQIRISTTSQTNASSFTVLKQWTEAELNATFNIYEEKVVPLNLPAGSTVYVAFVMVVNQTGTATSGDRWLVDKVKVVDQCVDPTGLAAGGVTQSSANLSWLNPGGATSFEVEILPGAGTATQHGIVINGAPAYTATATQTGSPLTSTAFAANTEYKYYVRALCGTGANATTSAWAGPFTFTTGAPGFTCSSAISVTSLPFTTTDNTSNYGDTTDVNQGTNCGSTVNYMTGNDVFYSYTATQTGVISVTLTPTATTNTYSGLFVYNGCTNVGVSCIAGVANATAGVRNIPAVAVTAGQTYIIAISTNTAPQNTAYTLNIDVVNCTPPSNLNAINIGQTTATLTWDNPGNLATTWQVALQDAGAAAPTGAGTTVTTNTSYQPTLVASHSYQYYVRAQCPDGSFSSWTGPFLFTTLQVPAALPFSDGFEGTNEWTLNNGTQVNKWAVGTATNNGGTRSMYISNNNGVANAYTLAPIAVVHAYRDIQLPATTNELNVSFDWRCVGEGFTGTFYDYFRVWAVPTSFNPVPGTQIVAGTGRIQLTGNVNNSATYTTSNYVLGASGFAGQSMRLIFEWRNDGSGGTQPPAAIDNVNVTAITCSAPTAIVVQTAGQNTATISWTAPISGAASYDYYVSTVNTAPTSTTVPTGTSTTPGATLNGLQASTTYYVWVRSNCGGTNGTSTWTGPATVITTQVPATLPYVDGFEGTNNWTLSNGTQVNKWAIGTATNNGGTNGMYISNNNGVANAYTVGTTAVVHAYRDIQVPAAIDELNVAFDWKAVGEGFAGTFYDYIRVWAVPTSFNPVPGTQIVAGAGRVQLTGNLNNSANYQTSNYVLPAAGFVGQTMRLVFEWRNDASGGTQPPGAVDNINVSVITCSAPSNINLDSAGSATADLSWTAPLSGASSYDYYLSTTNTAPTSSTTPTANVPTADVGLTTLQPSTTYYFWVRSNCGANGTSTWTGPFSFTTSQIPAALNFIDGFEGTTGWTLNNGTQVNKWVIGSATSNGGTQSLYISNNNGTANAYTVASTSVVHAYRDIAMPAVIGDLSLTFDWKAVGEGFSSTFYDYFRVWAVPTTFNPTPGTQIVAGPGRVQIGANFNNSAAWLSPNFIFPANTFSGQTMRLVFEWRNDGSGGAQPPAAIDNINLSQLTCPAPINLLASSNPNSNALTLTWTPVGNETQWEIVVQEAIDGAPVSGTIVNGTPSFSYVAQPGVFYEFYVRAICSPTDSSFWAGPSAFSIYSPPGCASVDLVGVGVDIVDQEIVLCAEEDNCVNLSASYFGIGATTSYDVSSINYDPPFPFTGGTEMNIATDDIWSPQIQLPFNFCFFGQSYSTAQVGSNGVLTFDSFTAPGNCPWQFNGQTIPNTAFPIKNAIYGVYQDLNPAIANPSGPVSINYQVLGTYPCRALVVNFSNVLQFQCGLATGPQTSQIVIYEISNIIEVYVERREPCLTWPTAAAAQGQGVIGIQNAGGTVAYSPEGRNTGPWSAVEEAYRFTPTGDSNVAFQWLKNDAFFSNDLDIEVCVTELTTMTAQATYTTCDGAVITKENEVTIRTTEPLPTNDPVTIISCSATGNPIFDLTPNNATITGGIPPADLLIEYYLTEAEAQAGDSTTAIQNPATYAGTSGQTVYVRISYVGTACFTVKSFQLQLGTNTPAVTQFSYNPSCIGSTTNPLPIPGTGFTANGVYSSTQVTVNTTTGEVDLASATPGTYDVTYTVTANGCNEGGSTTTQITISPLPVADQFADLQACDVYVLPALSANNSYYTGTNGTGTQLAVGSEIRSSQLIYVFASTGVNCSSESDFFVTITESPIVSVTGACQAGNYTIEAEILNETLNADDFVFQWTDETGNVIETNSQVIVVSTSGIYNVKVSPVVPTTVDCSVTQPFEANGTTCQIPKGISPNGDGKNDSFDLTGLQVRKISIFNRYGTIVFDYSNYTDQWHGQSNKGDELPDGTYFYSFERDGGESKTGWIYINRQRN